MQKIFKKVKLSSRAYRRQWIDYFLPSFQIKRHVPNQIHQFIEGVDIDRLPKEQILDLANRYVRHSFNLLGSGWVTVQKGMQCKGIEGVCFRSEMSGGIQTANRNICSKISSYLSSSYVPIDWHIDFISGYRWNENTWSEKIAYGKILGADIKVPWELARMQHLSMFAWSYAMTHDSRWITEFQDQILDFIAHNPPRYGVNWVCTMDVGIRVANWLFAYDLFRAYGAAFSHDFESVFFRSLYEHGAHIYSHLEWDPELRSNHYLANIAGLLFVAAYLPTDPETKKWLEFSIKELKSEFFLQFQDDGSNFEGSTSYHRLSAEMILYSTCMAYQKGLDFSESYLSKIKKMIEFIHDITKPDGTIVQFGDNDSGRFIRPFPETVGLDHRYLMIQIETLKNFRTFLEAQLQPAFHASKMRARYDDFGLYLIREKPWFLALRCGSIGQKGNGGHAHNDQLSFELAVHGMSLIIDPGTFVYTPLPDLRRKFRSTEMHNTLAWDAEQNKDLGLFSMKDTAKARLVTFHEKQITAQHFGFGSLYQRTIRVDSAQIIGKDEFAFPAKIHFHLAPGWRVLMDSERKINLLFQDLSIQFEAHSGKILQSSYEYSCEYGTKVAAEKFTLQTTEPTTLWAFHNLSSRKSLEASL